MSTSFSGALPWHETMSESEFIEFSHIHQEALHQLKFLSIANFDNIGVEGFVDGVKRLFTGIFNIILHMVHTFKTNVFKFYKTLKRTEFVYFRESNAVSLRRVLSFDYTMLTDLEVPLPNKMGVPYVQATKLGLDCLGVLDMESRIKLLIKHTEDLRNNALGSVSHNLPITVVNPQDLLTITNSFKQFDRCFVDSPTRFKKFSTLFPTPNDLKTMCDLLDNAANYQYGVAKVNEALDTVVKNLNDILAFLDKNTGTMTKKELMDLSSTAMVYAKLFDMYGVSIQDMARIEHNFVYVIEAIRQKFNL